MTSNGVASGAAQASGVQTPERLSQAAAARPADGEGGRRERSAERPLRRPRQTPPQVYDARGRLVPGPAVPSVELKA